MTAFYVKAENYIEKEAEEALNAIEGFTASKVFPELQQFIEQFSTDFGKAALAAAEAAAQAVLTSQSTIIAAATNVYQTLINQGLQIAETDGLNVVLNAIRVFLNAAPATSAPAVNVAPTV